MSKRSAALKARAAISLSQDSDDAAAWDDDEEEDEEEEEDLPKKRGSSSKDSRRPSMSKRDESSHDDDSEISDGEESSEHSGGRKAARGGKKNKSLTPGPSAASEKTKGSGTKPAKKTPASSSKKIVEKSPVAGSPSGRKRKAAAEEQQQGGGGSTEPSVVLSKVVRLHREQEQRRQGREASQNGPAGISAATTASALTLAGGKLLEVAELGSEDVARKIESLVVSVVNQVLAGGSFELTVPSRASNNQIYIEEVDRNVLGDKVSRRQFLNTAHARKAAITTRVVQLVHEVVSKRIHITKRDLFYTDVKLFKDQTESDAVLDDVACMLGCTRTSLHVVASDKGLVVGRIQYLEDGDLIDCTKMGVGGKAIPPYVDRISGIRSDARFILLVEKEAAYMRLAEDRFYNKYPCIIITGKGQPDVASRLFLRKLKDELGLPVLGMVDSDPYGLKILSVYMSGSKHMAYDSAHLTTPDIKWLGIRPSDLDRYNLPAQCRLPLTEHDIKMGKELLQEAFITRNAAWVAELELMLRSGHKAEIQALSSFGFQYVTDEYLPRKLREGDWI